LELTVLNLRSQLRTQSELDSMLSSGKGKVEIGDDVELGAFRNIRPLSLEPREGFLSTLYERGSWLASLLVFQSFSSLILVANEGLLATHPNIIFFLTMLVGAGGNAGNQAAVRVIRGLAVGSITARTRARFLRSELYMALALCCSVGFIGLLRTLISSRTSTEENVAITVALVAIIFISVVLGAALPFVLQYFKFDPAHSSTSIQVCSVPSLCVDVCTPCPVYIAYSLFSGCVSLMTLIDELTNYYYYTGDNGYSWGAHHVCGGYGGAGSEHRARHRGGSPACGRRALTAY
jgi:cation transporter-like permease